MPRCPRARRTAGAAAAVLGLALATGCSSPPLSVGIAYDRPGLGVRAGDAYSGFDYVLGKDLARRLGATGKKAVSFPFVPERRVVPAEGQPGYDVLVAAYPATDAMRSRSDLVGPYLRGRQDIAVRADDPDQITPTSLSGRSVCLVAGSQMGAQAPSTFPGADITYRPTLSTCLTDLREGRVDAVSDEGLALRGYAAEQPFHGSIRVVDTTLPPLDYYVVVSRAHPGLCRQVRDALAAAVRDGTWTRAYTEQLVRTGVVPTAPAPPIRVSGCTGATG